MLHILARHIQSQKPSSITKQRGYFSKKILDIFHDRSLEHFRTSGGKTLSDPKLVVFLNSVQAGNIPAQEVRSALWEYVHIHATEDLTHMINAESILEYHRKKTLPEIDISASHYYRVFEKYLPVIYQRSRQALEQKGIFTRFFRSETPEKQEKRKQFMKKAGYLNTHRILSQIPDEDKKKLIKIYFHTHILSRVIGKLEILESE